MEFREVYKTNSCKQKTPTFQSGYKINMAARQRRGSYLLSPLRRMNQNQLNQGGWKN